MASPGCRRSGRASRRGWAKSGLGKNRRRTRSRPRRLRHQRINLPKVVCIDGVAEVQNVCNRSEGSRTAGSGGDGCCRRQMGRRIAHVSSAGETEVSFSGRATKGWLG